MLFVKSELKKSFKKTIKVTSWLMLEAPPNRKATFPAIAKAWPCLLKMTRTIRKSNYQLPHFFFTKNPILSIFSVFSTLLLEALNGFMSSHGSKRSCRESESSVQSEIVKCFVTAQKQSDKPWTWGVSSHLFFQPLTAC